MITATGLGQMWVFTKKGKVVKIIGKELPPSSSFSSKDAPPGDGAGGAGGQGGGEGGSGGTHRPQALF